MEHQIPSGKAFWRITFLAEFHRCDPPVNTAHSIYQREATCRKKYDSRPSSQARQAAKPAREPTSRPARQAARPARIQPNRPTHQQPRKTSSQASQAARPARQPNQPSQPGSPAGSQASQVAQRGPGAAGAQKCKVYIASIQRIVAVWDSLRNSVVGPSGQRPTRGQPQADDSSTVGTH